MNRLLIFVFSVLVFQSAHAIDDGYYEVRQPQVKDIGSLLIFEGLFCQRSLCTPNRVSSHGELKLERQGRNSEERISKSDFLRELSGKIHVFVSAGKIDRAVIVKEGGL